MSRARLADMDVGELIGSLDKNDSSPDGCTCSLCLAHELGRRATTWRALADGWQKQSVERGMAYSKLLEDFTELTHRFNALRAGAKDEA